jgi:hypothetical protein
VQIRFVPGTWYVKEMKFFLQREGDSIPGV